MHLYHKHAYDGAVHACTHTRHLDTNMKTCRQHAAVGTHGHMHDCTPEDAPHDFNTQDWANAGMHKWVVAALQDGAPRTKDKLRVAPAIIASPPPACLVFIQAELKRSGVFEVNCQ